MRSEESNLLEKRRSITDADRRQLSIVLTLGWAALTLILFSLVLVMDYRRFESDFYDISQRVKDRLDARIAKNEAVLEGFASFLAGMQSYDEKQLTQYAKRIVERFPHVFMLEVATRVAAADEDRFIAQEHRLGYPEFRIKSFDYRGTREWRQPPAAPYYYPLTFIYPMLEESRPVLGLDLGSHVNLSLPLQRALRTGSYQTSLPFRLVEGYDAYVMFMPVYHAQAGRSQPVDPGGARPLRIVLLVLLQDRLLMQVKRMLPDSLGLVIYHSDKPRDDPIGWLYNKPASGTGLLPSLVREYKLEPEREGFMLRISQSFGPDAISFDMLIYAAIASALTFYFIRHFILRRYRRELERSRKEARLELLASYDPVTQLPNRNHLQELLEKAKRELDEDASLTLILMDLEDLRQVNDQYGHAAGDHVLKTVAERIRQILDKGDLVARVGGDEFTAVLKSQQNDEQLSTLVDELTRCIQEPIDVDQASVFVKVNVGIAFYPEGVNETEQLIDLADKVMYQGKRTRERWIHS